MGGIAIERRVPLVFGQRACSFEEAFGKLPTPRPGREATNFGILKRILWKTIKDHEQGEMIPLCERMVRLTGEEIWELERFSFCRGEILFTAYREPLSIASPWRDIFYRGYDETPSRREVSKMTPPLDITKELIFVCLETDLSVQTGQGGNSEFDIGLVTKSEWDELNLARASIV